MKKKYLLFILSLTIFFWLIWYLYFQSFWNTKNDLVNKNCKYDYVEKVYDGDTVLWKKLWKIRLIGIDAPEIFHPGWTKVKSYKFFGCWEEAKKIADKFLLHKNILFCSDSIVKDRWKYGRHLRYAMIKSWGILEPFWKYLLKTWYAKVYKYADCKYKKEYEAIEKENKAEHLGVWSSWCILQDKIFKQKHLK